MGSGQSTRIRSADITERKRELKKHRNSTEVTPPNTNTEAAEVISRGIGQNNSNGNKPEERTIADLQKQITILNQQMTEMECQNLDLQDNIQSLEQQLEFNRQGINSQENYGETVNLKQQEVEKLQAEVESLNSEKSKMRIKFKKKLRLMKVKILESKNEGSLDIYDMKETVKKLTEENMILKEKCKFGKEEKPVDSIAESEDTGKTKIILELSSRVSEQEAKIIELENRLTEKDKQLIRVEKRLEQQSKSEHETSDKVQPPFSSTNVTRVSHKSDKKQDGNWYTNMTFEQLASVKSDYHNETVSPPGENEDDELKNIAKEIRDLQRRNRRKKTQKTNGKLPAVEEKEEDKSRGVISSSAYPSHSSDNTTLTSDVYNRNDSGSSKHSFLSHDHQDAGLINTDETVNSMKKSLRESDCDNSKNNTGVFLTDIKCDGGESARSTPIDPSSIRQISSLGIKSKSKKQSKFSDQKDPQYLLDNSTQRPRVKLSEGDLCEADKLIHSIDEDLFHYSNTSTNTAPVATLVSS